MEEETLIKKVKRDDDLALRNLIGQYERMIYKIIHTYSLSQGDYCVAMDELFQEGCIGIYEACKIFDLKSTCKFSTFAYIVIKRRINKAIFKSLNIYKNECVSIDKNENLQNSFVYETKYVEDNPISYQDSINRKNKLNKIINNLDTLDRKIIRLRLDNYSYKEISKMLKIPCKKIDNRLQCLRKRRFNIKDTM